MDWSINHPILVTVGVVFLAVILVLLVFRIFPLVLGDTKGPQIASSMASLVIVGLIGVFLSNVLQGVRAKEARLGTLRDQHLSQLRPALKAEAQSLQSLVNGIESQGHLSNVRQDALNDARMLEGRLWPETMSADLRNHFPDYDDGKKALLVDVQQQEREFRDTVAELANAIHDKRLPDFWKELVPVSYLQKRMGINNGMVLTVNPSGGYSFQFGGGSVSGSGGSPSSDQLEAFAAYENLKPSKEVLARCDSLKTRANSIKNRASDLSKQALRLSEGTVVLRGECEFLVAN